MNHLFSLEVEASCISAILIGDEVIVNPNMAPRGNGKDVGLFSKDGRKFISKFTRYGNRILLLGDHGQIQGIVKTADIDVVGTVVGGSFELDCFSSIGKLQEVLL